MTIFHVPTLPAFNFKFMCVCCLSSTLKPAVMAFIPGIPNTAFLKFIRVYSETCVREPHLRLTSAIDVERWLSYKGTCHVILLAKLHDMYLYKTDTFSTSTTILSQSQRWLFYTGFTVQGNSFDLLNQ